MDPQAAEEESKEYNGVKPEHMKKYSRYAVEEIIRRGLKKDDQPLSKTDILGVLVPNH